MDTTTLCSHVADDATQRREWTERQEEIIKARLCDRPEVKMYPYEGAPNFVDRIIDDAVRDKTDQEVSMLWNTTKICHAAPLGPVSPETRSTIEAAFDCYLRYVIKIRPLLENGMDTKNLNGFVVLKQIRKFNKLLKKVVPDAEVKEIYDVIVPTDSKDFETAVRICDVIKETKSTFFSKARERNWLNAQKVWDDAHRDDSNAKSDEDSYFDKIKALSGLATANHSGRIILWEVYTFADEEDVIELQAAGDTAVEVGDRIVTVVCPDCPEETLEKYAWRECDMVAVDIDDDGNPYEIIVEKGARRSIPFVQARYEYRNGYYYLSRGIGELCYDDQVEATANKNCKYVQMEYYTNPILKGVAENTGNMTFAPGSTVDRNAEFLTPPQVSQQFDFNSNSCRATASRRVGAVGMYNFSQQAASTRKVQKSATEVDSDNARAANISSCSIDRFNEPLGDLFQLIWEDMARMGLEFPIFTPVDGVMGHADASIYQTPIVLVPASSAKTLNPEGLLARMMQITDFLANKAQAGVPFDVTRACMDVAAQFDSRLTRDWIIDPKGQGPNGQPPIYQMLQQMQKQIQLVAQGGKDLTERIKGVEKLSVENADNIERANHAGKTPA